MLPTLAELRRSVAAALRLILGRPDGLLGLDLSVDGFWRSFGVFAYLLPFTLVDAAVSDRFRADLPAGGDEALRGLPLFLLQATASLLAWIALPVLLALVAKPLGIGRRYVAFVVARNWAALPEAIPFAFGGLLYIAGAIEVGTLSSITLMALAFWAFATLQVARLSLAAPLSTVLAVTLLEILLGLAIGVAAARLFG